MALLPVADAIEQILRGVEPLPAESVGLSDALGRVLAEEKSFLWEKPPK